MRKTKSARLLQAFQCMDAFRLEETICPTATIQAGAIPVTAALVTAAMEPPPDQADRHGTADRMGARARVRTAAARTTTTPMEAARTTRPLMAALLMRLTTLTRAAPGHTLAAHTAAALTMRHHMATEAVPHTVALLAHIVGIRTARHARGLPGAAHPGAVRRATRPDTAVALRALLAAIVRDATMAVTRVAVAPVRATVASKALGPTTTAGVRATFACPTRVTRSIRGTCACLEVRFPKGSPRWTAG